MGNFLIPLYGSYRGTYSRILLGAPKLQPRSTCRKHHQLLVNVLADALTLGSGCQKHQEGWENTLDSSAPHGIFFLQLRLRYSASGVPQLQHWDYKDSPSDDGPLVAE